MHASGLVGGHRAVDFVNTLGGRNDTTDDEYIYRYADLLVWSERRQLIDSQLASTLARTAERRPQSAATALQDALQLRGHVDAVLRAALARRAARAADLDAVRRAGGDALAHAGV